MSAPPASNLKSLVRLARLRLLRVWLWALGAVVSLFALGWLGGPLETLIYRTKWWGGGEALVTVLMSMGTARSLVFPTVGVGLALLVAGVVVTFFIWKIEKNLDQSA